MSGLVLLKIPSVPLHLGGTYYYLYYHTHHSIENATQTRNTSHAISSLSPSHSPTIHLTHTQTHERLRARGRARSCGFCHDYRVKYGAHTHSACNVWCLMCTLSTLAAKIKSHRVFRGFLFVELKGSHSIRKAKRDEMRLARRDIQRARDCV